VIGLCLGLALAAAPEPAQLMPCTPGLRIEYRLTDAGTPKADVTESVRGPGSEPNTCVLDRTTHYTDGRTRSEAPMRELLPDRVSNAGTADQPIAFRPPYLMGPIAPGKKWRFERSAYEIAAVDETLVVPAGTFKGCVRVVERGIGIELHAESVYAPGVGLLSFDSGPLKMVATRVVVPRAVPDLPPGANLPVIGGASPPAGRTGTPSRPTKRAQ
jgi:hypothetical protein